MYIKITNDEYCFRWVKLNPGFTGFYRVNYSDDMMQLLMKAVKNNELGCLDRLNIVNDAYAMVGVC